MHRHGNAQRSRAKSRSVFTKRQRRSCTSEHKRRKNASIYPTDDRVIMSKYHWCSRAPSQKQTPTHTHPLPTLHSPHTPRSTQTKAHTHSTTLHPQRNRTADLPPQDTTTQRFRVFVRDKSTREAQVQEIPKWHALPLPRVSPPLPPLVSVQEENWESQQVQNTHRPTPHRFPSASQSGTRPPDEPLLAAHTPSSYRFSLAALPCPTSPLRTHSLSFGSP
mmetsp:Transcript_2238/g.4714  ORF Transcript_2238/g.4714 Transcript_2238/m.4714 type:complete len:220 (-) Transcript_2238:1291-1950(-)